MPGISTAALSSPDILPKSNQTFKSLCIRYVHAAYSTAVKKGKSLPLAAIARYEDILFKISEAYSIDGFISEINIDGKKAGKKSAYKEVVYFNEDDRFRDLSIQRMIRKNKTHTAFEHKIITNLDISSYLASSNSFNSFKDISTNNIYELYQKRDFSVISFIAIMDELMNYVYTAAPKANKKNNGKMSVDRLKLKIAANFEADEWERVDTYYRRNWEVKLMVEKYVQDNFYIKNRQLFALRNKVQSEFEKITFKHKAETDINYCGDFMKIAESIIPQKGSYSGEYQQVAEATVLYFFEYCDFGRRYVSEELSLFQKHEAERLIDISK